MLLQALLWLTRARTGSLPATLEPADLDVHLLPRPGDGLGSRFAPALCPLPHDLVAHLQCGKTLMLLAYRSCTFCSCPCCRACWCDWLFHCMAA